MVTLFIAETMIENILVAMSKSMEKQFILPTVVQWWAFGFFEANLDFKCGQVSKQLRQYYDDLLEQKVRTINHATGV